MESSESSKRRRLGCSSESMGVANVERNDDGVDCKHKVFLSHSGEQKDFVQRMCDEIESHDRSAFFDRNRYCLPLGCDFPKEIFKALEECEVGVVVLSKAFFTKTTWPMEEFARLVKRQEEDKDFVIIPVLYDIQLAECRDVEKQKEWKEQWQVWADKNKRIVMEDWTAVFKLFGPTLSISYVREAGGEKRLVKEVVEEICKRVGSLARLDDPDMQGRDRMCELVCEKLRASQVPREDGACVVGLYGVGGIGKSTLCKALCQVLRSEFGGRVCHAELATNSDDEKENELLGEVVKRLIRTPPEVVARYNKSERLNLLRDKLWTQKVFLAIDNVGYGESAWKQAKALLKAKFAKGSFVVVMARTIEMLRHVGIDERDCQEMPELDDKETKSLFMNNAPKIPDLDDALIKKCVGMCYFSKGAGKGYHFHPLALKVLGGQLSYDPEDWVLQLGGSDPFNTSEDKVHPIFSVLRWSFDLLMPKDQFLFMDLALFFPERTSHLAYLSYKGMNIITWLCMIHGRSEENLMSQLKLLKRKSVIECIGDGTGVVGMHDLWREFCLAESRKDDPGSQPWFHRKDGTCGSSEERKFYSGGWKNLQRVSLTATWYSLSGMEVKKMNLRHCSNLTVLKLVNVEVKSRLVDVSPLLQLKSLEVLLESDSIELQGLGLLEDLCVLIWSCVPSHSTSIGEIASLINLEALELRPASFWDPECITYPDLSGLSCLQLVTLSHGHLPSHLVWSSVASLQCLCLIGSRGMQSCSGLEDMGALVELNLGGCCDLEMLPSLEKLKKLQKLEISACGVPTVPGLDCLVALREFKAIECRRLKTLPDMQMLSNLEVLDLTDCLVEPILGLEKLIALRQLCVHFDSVEHCPGQAQLMKMQKLEIVSWGERGLPCLVGWTGLEELRISNCHGVCKLEGLESLSSLRRLEIEECGFQDVSIVSCLTSLETLWICKCNRLETVPSLDQLLKLENLELSGLVTKTWEVCGTLLQLRNLCVEDLPLHCLPNLSNFPQLRMLDLSRCYSLTSVASDGPMAKLELLDISDCSSLESVPSFWGCVGLTTITIEDCHSLKEMPNIRASKMLKNCNVNGKKLRVDGGEYLWEEQESHGEYLIDNS